ncbi:hypothetical protein [Bordetella petrii]|uniref:hypothetical protein n=1 Tax=Bordetella petrii TaxID=94624 RepID=UPI001A97BCF3|nr:hypothetical protein [Bordetella petrii]MBO1111292.1 hypothetical protein [Bordetella petrii]
MNRSDFFENLKDMMRNEFFSKCSPDFDVHDLALDYGNNMDYRINMFFELIRELTERIRLAREGNDEVAMRVALLHIRGYSMSLSTVFNSLVDDIETLLRSGEWPEIPENYRFPE